MKFILEVDMGNNAFQGNAVAEMGRILRYWSGNLKHFKMQPGDGCVVYDSEYREVGQWRIVEDEPAKAQGGPAHSPIRPQDPNRTRSGTS